jgi:hypothetical protein
MNSCATLTQVRKIQFTISEVKFLFNIINTNLSNFNKKNIKLDKYLELIFKIFENLNNQNRILYEYYKEYNNILHWWYHYFLNIWNFDN